MGRWRTALDNVTLDVSKSNFVTFSLARFGRLEPPCAHNRPMKDVKDRRFAKTPTRKKKINIFIPKKSKDRLRWGHAIAVVVQKGLGLFPSYVREIARNGVCDSLLPRFWVAPQYSSDQASLSTRFHFILQFDAQSVWANDEIFPDACNHSRYQTRM